MFARRFRISAQPGEVQQIRPEGSHQRFEGVAFSPDGAVLGSATADTDAVLLFRRRRDGRFEDEAYARIDGLHYPHDLAFGKSGETVLLAVAERSGAISVFEERGAGMFDPQPASVIDGPQARLSHTDGVTFVPPHNDCLAACNLITGTISFYQQVPHTPTRFCNAPAAELMHPSMNNPDGLAFSPDGRWLAVANHGSHSISLFERQGSAAKGQTPVYGPEPATVINDANLRHTHSVAFTDGGHVVATSAGANYFIVYRTSRLLFRRRLQAQPIHRQAVADDEVFREVNATNKMEGGPKGIAVHGGTLAVCSPEIGIKLYAFQG